MQSGIVDAITDARASSLLETMLCCKDVGQSLIIHSESDECTRTMLLGSFKYSKLNGDNNILKKMIVLRN